MNVRRIICVGVFLVFSCRVAPFDESKAEQIPIERVELMPNEPSPYLMRDWKQVAIDYDNLVFNFDATGLYLPLGWWDREHVNLPTKSFGMRSYVKDWTTEGSGEAINCIAAVVSATLVEIDKSNHNQSDNNFVYMCQNWRNPWEKMIMNNPTERNPCSFWYVLLPNILFDQLVYYYPNVDNMSLIMYDAALKWYKAADVMRKDENGFAYEGFDFRTMKPYAGTHKEPDAAAGIAWIEYMAYVKFNETRFLNAAGWCLQWLTSLTYNPLYEILLPYGAYTAARMNGELCRSYDIHKLINWCFGPSDARYGWGVIARNWGGYGCHGLHGSITDGGGYAFAMGTYENVGCLVPLVRYDDRYARAIGKYVLNAANAARLFFGDGLNDGHQDSEDWIYEYDENYCISYEALRKVWGGISPLATGDVNRDRYLHQTGDTNLGLYGSSHVGIFGEIIKPTNNEKILQLDCLVTDYFHDTAYPTYLYYNPYNDAKTIEINVGQDPKDLYDATTNDFLATKVSDLVSFILPANSAALVVVVPANGSITYDNNKTLINGVVVDYIPNSHSCDETLHAVPKAYTLTQSYPNPFNNETVILFTLPKGGEVSMKVYDVMGQEVATLIDGKMEAGEHSINWVAKDLTSGVYMCRLSFNGFEKTKKMLLVR